MRINMIRALKIVITLHIGNVRHLAKNTAYADDNNN
jgi:hypothetical protein